jgi:hypothetical protein
METSEGCHSAQVRTLESLMLVQGVNLFHPPQTQKRAGGGCLPHPQVGLYADALLSPPGDNAASPANRPAEVHALNAGRDQVAWP